MQLSHLQTEATRKMLMAMLLQAAALPKGTSVEADAAQQSAPGGLLVTAAASQVIPVAPLALLIVQLQICHHSHHPFALLAIEPSFNCSWRACATLHQRAFQQQQQQLRPPHQLPEKLKALWKVWG
jgi:hypothetical protein